MALRIPWSDHEATLLLRALIDVLAKKVERKTLTSAVSKELCQRAIKTGIDIDEKFRNESGIALQVSKPKDVFREKTFWSIRYNWMVF